MAPPSKSAVRSTSPSRARDCPPRHSRDLRTTRGPDVRPLRRQVLRFDLNEETAALRREHGWRDSGHSAKTLVKHHDQRIVLIAMKPGARMMKHQTAGAVSIQVLSGRLQVIVGKATVEVSSGGLLALDRALPHAVEALDASSVVLTVSSKPRSRRAAGDARSK